QKIIAPDKGDLAWMKRFGGDLVRCVAENRHQAKDLSRLSDSQDQRLTRARTNRKLHLAGAQNKNSSRVLVFQIENRSARIGSRRANDIKVFEGIGLKLAEETGRPQVAVFAAIARFKSVGSAHVHSPFLRPFVNSLARSAKCLVRGEATTMSARVAR